MAVAPLAREERYLRDLRELLHRMTRDSHPTGGNWLRQSIIAPANGQVPDLPPVLWQQILRDVLSRGERAPSAQPSPAAPQPPSASHAPYTVPDPTTAPEPSSTPPRPPTLTSRLSDLTNNPGCVTMGVGSSVIAVLITIVLIVLSNPRCCPGYGNAISCSRAHPSCWRTHFGRFEVEGEAWTATVPWRPATPWSRSARASVR